MPHPQARPFFLSAPIAVLAAGVLLLGEGAAALSSSWAPQTLALTHVGTLGFLGMALLGFVYQTASTLAEPMQGRRLARSVLVLMWIGVVCLVWALLRTSTWAVMASLSTLAAALLVFVVTVLRALRGVRDETASDLRIALGSLLLSAALGLWMVHGHGGMRFPGPRPLWIQVHLSVALLGWVGPLLASFARERAPASSTRASAGTARRLLLLGIALPVLVLGLDAAGLAGGASRASRLALLGALPAAVAVCVVHPLAWLRRRASCAARLRVFFDTGFALAPVSAFVALAAHLLDPAHWRVLLGWLAIWGWAGTSTHALLRNAVLGDADRSARPGFVLHVASLISGAAAVLSGSGWLARLTALLLLALSLELGRAILQGSIRLRDEGGCSSSRSAPR